MNSGRRDLTGEGNQVPACVLCLGSNPGLGGAEPARKADVLVPGDKKGKQTSKEGTG